MEVTYQQVNFNWSSFSCILVSKAMLVSSLFFVIKIPPYFSIALGEEPDMAKHLRSRAAAALCQQQHRKQVLSKQHLIRLSGVQYHCQHNKQGNRYGWVFGDTICCPE